MKKFNQILNLAWERRPLHLQIMLFVFMVMIGCSFGLTIQEAAKYNSVLVLPAIPLLVALIAASQIIYTGRDQCRWSLLTVVVVAAAFLCWRQDMPVGFPAGFMVFFTGVNLLAVWGEKKDETDAEVTIDAVVHENGAAQDDGEEDTDPQPASEVGEDAQVGSHKSYAFPICVTATSAETKSPKSWAIAVTLLSWIGFIILLFYCINHGPDWPMLCLLIDCFLYGALLSPCIEDW